MKTWILVLHLMTPGLDTPLNLTLAYPDQMSCVQVELWARKTLNASGTCKKAAQGRAKAN